MSDAQTRRTVLTAAHHWLDTPYQHQASLRGVGTDCLGLIRGIWRELYGAEPETPPPYTPDWVAKSERETLCEAANRWLRPVEHAEPGDILLFRMQSGVPCKHIAILSAPDRILHAYWGKAVIESHLVPYWQRRRAFNFAFPPLSPENLS